MWLVSLSCMLRCLFGSSCPSRCNLNGTARYGLSSCTGGKPPSLSLQDRPGTFSVQAVPLGCASSVLCSVQSPAMASHGAQSPFCVLQTTDLLSQVHVASLPTIPELTSYTDTGMGSVAGSSVVLLHPLRAHSGAFTASSTPASQPDAFLWFQSPNNLKS